MCMPATDPPHPQHLDLHAAAAVQAASPSARPVNVAVTMLDWREERCAQVLMSRSLLLSTATYCIRYNCSESLHVHWKLGNNSAMIIKDVIHIRLLEYHLFKCLRFWQIHAGFTDSDVDTAVCCGKTEQDPMTKGIKSNAFYRHLPAYTPSVTAKA